MKRSSSAARSYLHQLVEPVPQQGALLATHRPDYDRRTALDAVPPILDSMSDSFTEAATPRRTATARIPRSRHEQTSPSQALPIEAATDQDHSSALSNSPARHSQRISDTPLAADEVLPRPGDATHEGPSARERLSPRNNATPQSEDLRKPFEQTPALAARIASTSSARDRSSRGSRVHIGTVEVRTIAPVGKPQPAPAIDRSARGSRSGFAAEPLSRPLAWSHGLVQG